MARRLSKKKISIWLLLLAVITFVCCGGPKKFSTAVKSIFSKDNTAQQVTQKPKPEDLVIDEELAERLDSFVEKTNRLGTLGLYVYDETANKEVYAFRADTLMRPASNMKMVTCLACLRHFGPNYKYTSGAYMNGKMQGDVLDGSIGLKFTFDPWLTPEQLHRLAAAFRDKGIHRVNGKVILDLAMHEPMQHEQHWTIGDLKTRKLGILFRGEKRMRTEVKYALRAVGVNFLDSQLVLARIPKGAKLLMKVSNPMHNSIFKALQNSSNEQAECLSFALAGLHDPNGDFRGAGVQSLRNFVSKELNADTTAVCCIHDGSGLCVHDRLTPRFLVRMLHYAYAHKYIYNELRRDLPVSGNSGTLHRRMTKPNLSGKIQAKTGTLTREDGITSLSGYVQGKNGHLLLFGLIQNEVPVADARLWQDNFCAQLVK